MPQDPTTIHQLLQDKSYSIADLKIILNPGKDDEKTILSRIEFLKQHNVYMANMLSEKYPDIETDKSVKLGYETTNVIKIEKDCPSKLMEILFTCLCSKNVMEAGNTPEFSISPNNAKEDVQKITFEKLFDLILFVNLAKQWNIECFNFSQVRAWIVQLFLEYNRWFIERHIHAATYCDVHAPQLIHRDPHSWTCYTLLQIGGFTGRCFEENDASAEICKKCKSSRAPPRRVFSRHIADLTPLHPVDDRIFDAWLNFLGDDCEEFYFFCLARASKSHRRVSQTSFKWLKEHGTEKYTEALKNDSIVAKIFYRTWFDASDGTRCWKETVHPSDGSSQNSGTGEASKKRNHDVMEGEGGPEKPTKRKRKLPSV